MSGSLACFNIVTTAISAASRGLNEYLGPKSFKGMYTYHKAGQGGNGSANSIDTVAFVDRDVTNGWAGAADGTLEQRFHPLPNWRVQVS